jgi:hypothetical protein
MWRQAWKQEILNENNKEFKGSREICSDGHAYSFNGIEKDGEDVRNHGQTRVTFRIWDDGLKIDN